MNVKVHQHTQLNGGVIESEAEASKNRLQTHSISSTDIENHSEIKTESASISAGSGGINPMQALSSALSLLGNRHESSRSHTKSAISQNIAIQTKTPENLTALSRDTKNANERVQKQDLQKVQEQQEMAKVIGEIVDNGISIATFEKREALNKLSLEKFQAEERYGKDSPQAKALGTQMQALQQQLDQEFGLGSEKGMAIRAVTAALQSAVQQDKAGAITALASPYLNREIHKLTEGDSTKEKATNLMAHALLSAVEFQVTGKDPLTGAMAGVTGEATAQYLTKALYNKAPSELTASEKETISSLSQLAGGLAGAFTPKANGSSEGQGGSFLSGVAGAETAKRAVENNMFYGVADLSYAITRNSKYCDDKCKAELDSIKLKGADAELKASAGVIALGITPQLATTSTLLAGGINSGVDFSVQLMDKKDLSKINYQDVLLSFGVGAVTKNMGMIGVATTNAGVSGLQAIRDGNDPIYNASASFGLSMVGYKLGSSAEKALNHKLNPNWKNYVFEEKYVPYPILAPARKSTIPSVGGNITDSISPVFGKYIMERISEDKNEN
ncbi:VENN motif pre-toxin domain-containing protein [Avibacterium paragallinarum]|nr:VENN motif pre-toxin domain-containing protein [Avibacterium paragallinarum]MEE3607470.1 VENN motif pre-toxin domain-containing protein [Avibacterium paragallinarum]MEE3682054.1 VENN motif pre-toxin domain-containing protein [Avibacterium paragallinarum]MEE4386767.1 VENN motif pre-toxin domain-containing protein [Avibacterium paragallinarum]